MAETSEKKSGINPGIVRSDSSYKQSKVSEAYNPTKQVAVSALPTAENEGTFVKMYAESLHLNWLQMASTIIEDKPQIITDLTQKPKSKVDKKQFKNKPAKSSKPAESEAINTAKFAEKTDMEIIMSSERIIQDKIAKKEEFVLPPELIVETVKPQRQNNVFEAINAIPVSQEQVVNKKADKDNLKETKPYIKIDKVEIRKSTNSEGETIYMIGKSVYSGAKFEEYLQGIYGKILAGQCRHIDIEDFSYTLQSDGSYKDNEGNLKSVDDLISILK